MSGGRRARAAREIVALCVGTVLALGPVAPGVDAGATRLSGESPRAFSLPEGVSADCRNNVNPVARADELLANRYRFPPHPIVTLPADLTWAENPFGDDNWQFQLHSLRYVLDLIEAKEVTGSTVYADRGRELLLDWYEDNPRASPASKWAWNDHSTALRAVVYACFAELRGMEPWLEATLDLHGRTLADPAFYRGTGNHALNQAIGLLEVARVLGRSDWLQLAAQRINDLIEASVDSQGVTNEQSIGYQLFNFDRYTRARDRLLAVGLEPASAFDRVELMPRFLAYATLPTGQYEMIGDTTASNARVIPGTIAEYTATRGASGPQPANLVARFNAGYLFVRSGWGERRAFTDETFWSTKWGPGPVFHGHADGLQVTLASYGARLLVDPGMYAYGGSSWRTFFKQRSAHNIVTVDGMSWPFTASSRLLTYAPTSRYVDLRSRTKGYTGVTHTRRVTYSRGLDFLLVEDRLVSSAAHTYRQLWHFVDDANVAVGVSSVWSQRAHGNVLVRQLAGSPTLRIVKGATSPIQGWISYSYGTKVAAPVEQAILRGTSVRFLTLIVPAEGKPTAAVSNLRLTSTGYSVTISIGGRTQRVTVEGTSIWMSTPA